MRDLHELQKLIVQFRDERNWKQFHNPKDMAISLVLEASELLEHVQWKSDEAFDQHLQTNKADVADELIDVLYWVLLIAHDLDVDLSEHFKQKMAKNAVKYPVKKAKGSRKKYTELKD